MQSLLLSQFSLQRHRFLLHLHQLCLAQDAGGLKEWTTDQGVDEESVLDSDAAA